MIWVEYNSTTEGATNDDRVATIPIHTNEYYEIASNGASYFETRGAFFLDRYDEPLCHPGVNPIDIKQAENFHWHE